MEFPIGNGDYYVVKSDNSVRLKTKDGGDHRLAEEAAQNVRSIFRVDEVRQEKQQKEQARKLADELRRNQADEKVFQGRRGKR